MPSAHAFLPLQEKRAELGGQRWQLVTDFSGLNLGVRLGTDLEALTEGGYNGIGANNNASNYSLVNALDLQTLLGLPIAGGNPVPAPIQQTIQERQAKAASAQGQAGE